MPLALPLGGSRAEGLAHSLPLARARAKQLLLYSAPLRFSAAGARLPLRIRPAMAALNVVALLGLAFLGFHPRGQAYVPFNDKVLHFVCFLAATALFYMIWDVDEDARRSWLWRNAPLSLTWLVCFLAGGVGSEFVQGLLPYKTFQWGDVAANLLGSSLGLFASFHFEKRYRAQREIARLYQPLDAEAYGDDDDEDWDDADVPRGSSAPRSERRVRFGDVWDAEDDELAPRRPPQAAASTASPASKAPQALFSIDDDEDDEPASPRPPAALATVAPPGEEAEAWAAQPQ